MRPVEDHQVERRCAFREELLLHIWRGRRVHADDEEGLLRSSDRILILELRAFQDGKIELEEEPDSRCQLKTSPAGQQIKTLIVVRD